MKAKKIHALLILLSLTLFSCSSGSNFVGTRFLPIAYDGTRIYGGTGTNRLAYVSTLTDTYGPFCSEPTCDHSSFDCGSYVTRIINCMTTDGDGNLIVAGGDFEDLGKYSIISIDSQTGNREYVVKQMSNNITSMIVVRDNLYFLTQLDRGGENEGNHSVCYVPLSGGSIKNVELPVNDYYFYGADEQYLYLEGYYDRTLTAVDYRNGHTYEVLHTFDETESTDCYIADGYLYVFSDKVRSEITASHDNYPDIDPALLTFDCGLYSVEKYDIATGELIGKTESVLTPSLWGYISADKLYLPHYAPILLDVSQNDNGEEVYRYNYNSGVDVIDLTTMEVSETIEIPSIDIDAIAYADEGKIVYYAFEHTDTMGRCMGWYDVSTQETHSYDYFWEGK